MLQGSWECFFLVPEAVCTLTVIPQEQTPQGENAQSMSWDLHAVSDYQPYVLGSLHVGPYSV